LPLGSRKKKDNRKVEVEEPYGGGPRSRELTWGGTTGFQDQDSEEEQKTQKTEGKTGD